MRGVLLAHVQCPADVLIQRAIGLRSGGHGGTVLDCPKWKWRRQEGHDAAPALLRRLPPPRRRSTAGPPA